MSNWAAHTSALATLSTDIKCNTADIALGFSLRSPLAYDFGQFLFRPLEKFAQQAERQAYAAEKRQQAAETPPAEKSPVAVLKALGAAQRDQHRQEWKDLSAGNKATGIEFSRIAARQSAKRPSDIRPNAGRSGRSSSARLGRRKAPTWLASRALPA